jgi:hypothetical protein
MRRYPIFLILGLPIFAFALRAQSNVGELRLKVTDPSGSGVKSSIELVCEANQLRQVYVTDSSGLRGNRAASRGAIRRTQIVERVNFARNRVKPSFSLDASLGAEVWKRDMVQVRLQADAANLTNRLNVIDFAGLFSGNAVAPPRSFAVRLETSF